MTTQPTFPLLPAFTGAPERDRVYNVDALTLLAALPDASVSAIIADPPYELTELDFDQQRFDWAAFWKQAARVLRNPSSPVILFSQQPFTTDLICSNRAWFRYEIIYEKTMPVGYLDAKRRPMRCHENILVFSKKQAFYAPVFTLTDDRVARVIDRKGQKAQHYSKHRRVGYVDSGKRYPRDVWRFAQRNSSFKNTKTLHPTEKPLLLMEKLIYLFTEPDALVIDCFAGSGTTGYAAIKNGRYFIGSDNGFDAKTQQYWSEVASARISQSYTLPLFAA